MHQTAIYINWTSEIHLCRGSITRSRWPRRGRIMDVPNTVVAMSSTSGALIAPRLVPKTKLFANSSSVILWKLLPWEISPTPLYIRLMCCPSCTPSCTTASLVLFTPKWSVIGLAKPARTGKLEIHWVFKTKSWNVFVQFQDSSTKVSFEGCHEPTTGSKSSSHLRWTQLRCISQCTKYSYRKIEEMKQSLPFFSLTVVFARASL